MLELPLKTDFTGKVVVVTGAGGVLCGDMARAFAQAGAKVAALDLNEDKVKKLAEELKNEGFICEGYAANVLEAEQVKAVHARILEDLGKCDFLINGAGAITNAQQPIMNTSMKQKKDRPRFLIWIRKGWILYSG